MNNTGNDSDYVEEPDQNDDGWEDEEQEEEEEEEILLAKPIFVPKSKRTTITKSKEEIEIEEEQKKREMEEKKKQQTRSLLAETLRRAEESKHLQISDTGSDAGIPEEVSDYEDEVEYEAWKLRELKRLKRDMEEREFSIREKRELLRRRAMTDEERLEEDQRNGKILSEEDKKNQKGKWKFMQKYYHQGAFYMDEDTLNKSSLLSSAVSSSANRDSMTTVVIDVRKKDYAAQPTLEDNIDKEKLPSILQVKNFGKKGRTKYTHLVDQDTTFQTSSHKLQSQYPAGGGGSGGSGGNNSSNRIDTRPDRRVMESYLGKRSGVKKF